MGTTPTASSKTFRPADRQTDGGIAFRPHYTAWQPETAPPISTQPRSYSATQLTQSFLVTNGSSVRGWMAPFCVCRLGRANGDAAAGDPFAAALQRENVRC